MTLVRSSVPGGYFTIHPGYFLYPPPLPSIVLCSLRAFPFHCASRAVVPHTLDPGHVRSPIERDHTFFLIYASTPFLSSLPPHALRSTTLHDLIRHRWLDFSFRTPFSEQNQNAWRVSPCLLFSVAVGGHTLRRVRSIGRFYSLKSPH